MSVRIQCQNCGQRVDVPPGYARAKLRCPGCGYYAEVPAEMRSAAPPADEPDTPDAAPPPRRKAAPPPPPDPEEWKTERKPKPPAVDDILRPGKAKPLGPPPDRDEDGPRPPRKKPKAAPPADNDDAIPPLLTGTEDEDDEKPYGVPGDATKKCVACGKELPRKATFCVHCGADLAAGKKKKRTFQPVDRVWESRWPYKTRLIMFGVLVGLNVLFLTATVIYGNGFEVIGFGTVLLNTAMQAFLVGTYEKLEVTRTAKGKATLTRTWRIAFVPKPPEEIDWKKNEALGISGSNNFGIFEWMMFFYLLTCTMCPPIGIGFFWVIMRPDTFEVALCDVYGSTDQIIFRTTSRETADEVAAVVADCTGLTYRRVM